MTPEQALAAGKAILADFARGHSPVEKGDLLRAVQKAEQGNSTPLLAIIEHSVKLVAAYQAAQQKRDEEADAKFDTEVRLKIRAAALEALRKELAKIRKAQARTSASHANFIAKRDGNGGPVAAQVGAANVLAGLDGEQRIIAYAIKTLEDNRNYGSLEAVAESLYST